MINFDDDDDDDDDFGFDDDETWDDYDDGFSDVSIQQGNFNCSFCGAANHTFIDPSQGMEQEYVEDCQTCCAPNLLRVNWQDDLSAWTMESGEE
ncbi:MAG: CPXCG motif-containing cysteine-rich protein [Balneolales bacterium]|nr:CPXCG motif-containing cysteine-rich protein [Balneolales bacterium]